MTRPLRTLVLAMVVITVAGFGHSDYWTGNDRFNKGDYQGAIEAYTKAIAKDSSNFAAWFHRATAHGFLNENELALADYDRAIRILPDFALAFHYRGHIHSKMRQYELAIGDYDSALASAGSVAVDAQGVAMVADKATVYYDRGNSHFNLRRLEDAVASYDSSITLAPKFGNAYNNRGFSRIGMGDSTGGCADLRIACKLGVQYACRWVRDTCGTR